MDFPGVGKNFPQQVLQVFHLREFRHLLLPFLFVAIGIAEVEGPIIGEEQEIGNRGLLTCIAGKLVRV